MAAASKFIRWTLLAACVAPLCGCSFLDSFVPKKGETTDVVDRTKNLTVDDFKDLGKMDKVADEMNAKAETTIAAELGVPPVPDVAQVLAAPRPPKVANTKLVSLSVTDDVPLRDVLFELGRLAAVDIEVGPGLDKTGINLRATDRPFSEVIERIATLANLRYSAKGKSIRVERDTAYVKNYSIDFLNMVRSSTTNYSLTTSVTAAGSGGGGSSSGGSSGGGGGGVGSSTSGSSISGSAESDLWTSLEASMTEILNYSPASSDSAAASGAASGGGASSGGSIIINRQAGVVSVTATERQHEMIQNFLTLMTRNASAQVLIEAKVVEVALTDQFASGVDWNRIIGDVSGRYNESLSLGQYLGTVPSTGSAISTSNSGNSAVTFGFNRGDLGAVMALTQQYGTTRTLSSPRLSAINNQAAVLTFAKNQVYFDCTYEPASTSTTSATSSDTKASLECTQRTVPIGIIMSILPSINLDTQEITLNVRPTLTRQVTTATSPVTGFLKSQAASASAAAAIPDISVPVIESRELDSITKVRSGGVMVIGGLMEDVARNSESGTPGLNELPIFGNLFKSRSEDTSKRELIIFIKATIVNSDGSSDKVDRAVYKKFITDPRPLFPKASDAAPDTLQ